MILIVGGAGFVGSAFVRCCQDRGLSYQVVTRANYDQYAGTSCDLLVNASGNSSKILAGRDSRKDFELSVRSVHTLLHDIKSNVYVHLSSCDVYPDCSNAESTSEALELPALGQSVYGFHKLLAEQCVRYFHGRWLIFRLGGMVGTGLRKNPIFDVLFGDRLWLNPASELQFIGTDAAAQAMLKLALEGPKNEVFNLCGNGLIALSEVMLAAERVPEVAPEAACVRYNVSVDKIKKLVKLPTTRTTILNFVEAWKHSQSDRRSTIPPAA